MHSGGGTPQLVAEAVKATSPVWSPDGNMIAYIDEEEPQLNIVRISNTGQAIGDPVSIDTPEAISFIKILAGWTPENKIGFLLVTEQESAIYTLPVQGGQAAMIQRTPGAFISQPRWSPDGQRIYYSAPPEEVNSEGIPYSSTSLASVQSTGGKGNPLPSNLNEKNLRLFNYGGGQELSPDGKTMVVGAYTTEDISSEYDYPFGRIWKIALDGTGSAQITKAKGAFIDTDPCWSPDGQMIAFIRHKLDNSDPGISDEDIYIVDSSGGEAHLLDSVPGKRFSDLLWSPDGKMLACFVREKEPPHLTTGNIYVFDTESKTGRIVGEKQKGIGYLYSELSWSPDSKKIAFNYNEEANYGIKVMTLSDGSIEDIETGLPDLDVMVHFDWSPDGERFVFIGWKNGNKEFWFLEDFLPLDKLPNVPADDHDLKSDAITIRQVWTGDYTDNCGTVSLDGKLLSFVDWGTGDLAIRKLSSGENVPLTTGGTWDDPMHFALNNVISHDGKKIAYSWYNENGTYDLNILNLEDSTSFTVYASDSLEEVYPVAWSCTDDALIVQYFVPVNNSYNWQLSYLNPSNGQLSPIKEFQTPFMTNFALASDDTYMAYDFPNLMHQGRFDINLRRLNDEKERSLVNHPANDRVLGWIPDTDKFLFISDRSGTTDIYVTAVSETTNNTYTPKRIVVNVGNIDPMGFTEEGSLYYSLSERKFESYIAQIDRVTGKIIDNPKTPLLGSLGDVCWLPDGKSMICVKLSHGPDNRPDYTLSYFNSRTSELRDLANQIMVNGMPRISPDLSSVLFYGIDKSSLNESVVRRGLFIADMNTGIAQFLQVNEDASSSYSAEWDAEGTSIFYTSNGRVIRHYLETGQEEVIYENPLINNPTLRRSYDGENLILDLQATEEEKHLVSIPVNGEEPTTICIIHASGTPLMYKKIVGSPNGEYIYYTLDSPESGSVIWRIPSSGGEAEKIWFSKNRITGLSPHPDGESMAISVLSQNLEIWVVENLLAELNKVSNPDE
jgi:Tol biopolymer transport system component